MSPEPSRVEAPWQMPPLLGTPWVEWQRFGLRTWKIAFAVTVVAMSGTTMWLQPSTGSGPSVWQVRLVALEGAACLLCGHTVLALRVAASEPGGRRQLVHAAIELILGGLGLLAAAGLLWLTIPAVPFAGKATLPPWLCVTDGIVAHCMLLIGFGALVDGVGTTAGVIYHDWDRPPPPPAAPPARPRVPVDSN